jgi:hypothetical protein
MRPPSLDELAGRINLALLFDHVGRAGNGFCLTVFDQHPQVLTCPWVHYLYSYFVTEFGDAPVVDSRKAVEFLQHKTYFRYVLKTPDREMARTMHRFGADPDTPLDRSLGRDVLNTLARAHDTVSRRDLFLAAYAAFALAAGRDLGQVRYILLADAVSLRTEHVRTGFSGKVLACARNDFPQARFLSMVRDPRAMFASNRHQFVNALGNMYAVAPGTFARRIKELATLDQRMDNSVWLIWMWYAAETGKTISRLKKEHPSRFLTVRNEDLNLRFVPTLRGLCRWLEVPFHAPWAAPDFEPTIVGRPWRGTGAYNSRYQTCTNGLLLNDPKEVADTVTGPNRYVTERWRTRLAPREMRLIERLFSQEMVQQGYEPTHPPQPDTSAGLLALLWHPLRGELPSVRWLRDGLAQGSGEFGRRLFYTLVFPLFSVLARLQFLRLHKKGVFRNPWISGPDETLLHPDTAGEEPAA